MPIIAKGSDTTFTPAPEGPHQAVCVDVIDMGDLEVTFGGHTKIQHKVRLAWQIEERMPDGTRFLVQKRYTCSLHPKSSLRKDLEAWRGRAFTAEELAGFDLEKLLGVNCLLGIQHAVKEGSTFANVVAIMPITRGMTKIVADTYVRMIDRTDREPESSPSDDDDIPF